MEVATATGASLRKAVDWHSLNWRSVHRNVRRLQSRIVQALKAGKYRKARALRIILTRSLSGKALAVKRVTENHGKRTPGVDNVIWNTPEKKAQAILDLQHAGYHPQPLKRVLIPKQHGQRVLGIPTLHDRAMQALHLLALDPVAETTGDPNSYGFRRGRSPADAIGQCYCALAKTTSAEWVLEGDIRSCFDELSHPWLLSNIPMDKAILNKWLKAGYVDRHGWNPMAAGVAQGGVISPVVCNLALDGLEQTLAKKFLPTQRIAKRNKVHLIRYSDDFVITGSSKELLKMEVKPLVESFLAERGLELSPTKTKITHIADGFDFLGTHIRKYDGKFLAKPSHKSVKTLLTKVREVIKGNVHIPTDKLILILNPIIKGWANYHRHVSSKRTFGKVDREVFLLVWQWAKKRHPTKSSNWIKKTYFHSKGARNWVFQATSQGTDGEQRVVRLTKAMDVPIKRHTKIRAEANPYDPAWEGYFEERLGLQMVEDLKGYKQLLRLWSAQDGVCPLCAEKITKQSGWNIHHIVPRSEGGTNRMSNLVLLHPNCHQQVHSRGWKVSKPRPVKRALGKA